MVLSKDQGRMHARLRHIPYGAATKPPCLQLSCAAARVILSRTITAPVCAKCILAPAMRPVKTQFLHIFGLPGAPELPAYVPCPPSPRSL